MYGFITPDDGSEDLFVHYSGIVQTGKDRRTLEENDAVEFEKTVGEKGPKAVNVKKV